jgi:hypothetical protein
MADNVDWPLVLHCKLDDRVPCCPLPPPDALPTLFEVLSRRKREGQVEGGRWLAAARGWEWLLRYGGGEDGLKRTSRVQTLLRSERGGERVNAVSVENKGKEKQRGQSKVAQIKPGGVVEVSYELIECCLVIPASQRLEESL